MVSGKSKGLSIQSALVHPNRILWIYAAILIIIGTYFAFAGGGHYAFNSDIKTADLVKVRIWLLLSAVMALLIYKSAYSSEKKAWMMILNISLYFMISYALFYKGTYFGLNGHWGDNGSKLALTTKFRDFWNPFQDWYFKDLPSFYPPLWFFVSGKLAWLLNLDAYRMPKIMYFVTYGVLPVALYYVWGKIVNKRTALFITFLTLFYRTSLLDYAPYEILSTAFFIPWWLYYVDDIKGIERKTVKWYMLGGFLGALIFMTYYFWFTVGIISLILRFVIRAVSRSKGQWGIRSFGHLFKIFGGLALFSSVYWLPYLVSIIIFGGYFTQGYWLRIGGIDFHMPFFEFNLEAAIYLIGLVYLGLRGKKAFNTAMLVILSAAAVAVLADRIYNLHGISTQTRKVFELGPIVLAVPAGAALSALYGYLKRRGVGFKRAFVLVAFAAAIFIGTGHRAAASGGLWEMAFKSGVPEKALDAFRTVDYKGKVFLTNKYIEAAYLPFYSFLYLGSASAHPASRYLERVAFLQDLAKVNNPSEVAWLMLHNKFDRIDYFYLPIDASTGNGFYDINILKFPTQNEKVHLEFPKATFAGSPYFIKKHKFGIYKVTEPEDVDVGAILKDENLCEYIDKSLKK